MAEIKDGGPAFPGEFIKHKAGDIGNSVAIRDKSSGMTLRDYFAAHAMQAALTSGKAAKESDIPWFLEQAAKFAYMEADAMLRAREVNHG